MEVFLLHITIKIETNGFDADVSTLSKIINTYALHKLNYNL